MKLTNYKLQTQIEQLSNEKSSNYFKEYLTSILEDNTKTYYQKADYVGLSLNELKNKIDSLSQDIKELQAFKKKLSTALDIAKSITAQSFIDNGIDRIDGNIISSLTLTKATTKTQTSIHILDENEVIKLGYVKFEPDLDAITEAINSNSEIQELNDYISIDKVSITTPAKIKVNTKRISLNTTIDEIMSINPIQQAA